MRSFWGGSTVPPVGFWVCSDNVTMWILSTNHEQPFCQKKYSLRKTTFFIQSTTIYTLYTHQFSMDPNKKHLPKQKSRHGRASKDANKRRNELSINGSASIGFPPQILRREPTGGCGGRELPGFRAGERLVTQWSCGNSNWPYPKKKIHGNGMFITEFHCLW